MSSVLVPDVQDPAAVIASVHTTSIDAGAPFDHEGVRFTDEQA